MQTMKHAGPVASENKSSDSPTTGRKLSPKQTVEALRPFGIQPKLTVGSVDDPAEREADRIADQVMRIPDSDVKAIPNANQFSKGHESVFRSLEGRYNKSNEDRQHVIRPKIRDSSSPGVKETLAPEFESSILSLGSGVPLPESERAFFEPRFGRDFSKVRVHTDTSATNAATSIGAKAFNIENHIVFKANQYKPKTTAGRHLMAHEIAHIDQRSNSLFEPTDIHSPTTKKNPKNNHSLTVRRKTDSITTTIAPPKDNKDIFYILNRPYTRERITKEENKKCRGRHGHRILCRSSIINNERIYYKYTLVTSQQYINKVPIKSADLSVNTEAKKNLIKPSKSERVTPTIITNKDNVEENKSEILINDNNNNDETLLERAIEYNNIKHKYNSKLINIINSVVQNPTLYFNSKGEGRIGENFVVLIKELQQTLNKIPSHIRGQRLVVDGKLGPNTIEKFHIWSRWRKQNEAQDEIIEYLQKNDITNNNVENKSNPERMSEVLGGLIDSSVAKIGEKKDLSTKFKVKLNPTLGIIFHFDMSIERDSNDVTIQAELAVGARGEANLGIIDAFAQAKVLGFVEASGDNGKEAIDQIQLGLWDLINTSNDELAGLIWTDEYINKIKAARDSSDFVTLGAGFEFNAGIDRNTTDATENKWGAEFKIRGTEARKLSINENTEIIRTTTASGTIKTSTVDTELKFTRKKIGTDTYGSLSFKVEKEININKLNLALKKDGMKTLFNAWLLETSGAAVESLQKNPDLNARTNNKKTLLDIVNQGSKFTITDELALSKAIGSENSIPNFLVAFNVELLITWGENGTVLNFIISKKQAVSFDINAKAFDAEINIKNSNVLFEKEKHFK